MFMKSVFHGRLTKAIELKHSNNGHAVCRFQLACDRYVGGDKGTITEYPSFVAWRGLAERLANNTQKGSELLIEAQYTSYKKNIEGEKYPITVVEFEVQSFDFCGSKKDGAAAPPQATAPASVPNKTPPATMDYSEPSYDDFEELEGNDNDLPF